MGLFLNSTDSKAIINAIKQMKKDLILQEYYIFIGKTNTITELEKSMEIIDKDIN